jgi:hypothetical protein
LSNGGSTSSAVASAAAPFTRTPRSSNRAGMATGGRASHGSTLLGGTGMSACGSGCRPATLPFPLPLPLPFAPFLVAAFLP